MRTPVGIDELLLADYEAAYALWSTTEGVGLSAADEREAIARYLARNPGMSSAARADGRLVATALAGHDGRRGYIHHVVVDPEMRGRGIGRSVVARSIERLAAEGIEKCHLFVLATNATGQAFWRAAGWGERGDLKVFSRSTKLGR